MAEMIGYCGYNCHLCAARSDDPVVRQKMVNGWRKLYGHEHYTAENVKCDGCLSDGKIADKQCKARPCAREKGVENCVYCDEFPCTKLEPLIPRLFFATEEEYKLCIQQFHSLPNLLKMLDKAGELPPWLREYANQISQAISPTQ